MKTTPRFDRTSGPHPSEHANARLVLLVLVCFLLGIGASAWWFGRQAPRARVTSAEPVGALTESTKAVLRHLNGPVEIHFYSLLDPNTVSPTLPGFASRVDQLLALYEAESNGKIKVVRCAPEANPSGNASAAVADGLTAFNIDKGDACFLGVAVVQKDRKETLAQLSPDWESALEPDLTRAIARVSTAPGMANTPAPRVDASAVEAVKSTVPNLATVSAEEGTKVLREAALKDFKAAASELDARVQAAQQRLSQAQAGGSEAEQQEARKQLLQAQAEQTEKLKQIAAQSKAQMEAFQQLRAQAAATQ